MAAQGRRPGQRQGGATCDQRAAPKSTRLPPALFLVQDAFKPIWGLGELAVYDTTERLRHRLGLESVHVIFLHAGTRVGARHLAGGRLGRDDAWGIHRHQVPDGLRHLTTHEIEDILCLYKDELLLTPEQFLSRRSKRGPSGCGPAHEPRAIC